MGRRQGSCQEPLQVPGQVPVKVTLEVSLRWQRQTGERGRGKGQVGIQEQVPKQVKIRQPQPRLRENEPTTEQVHTVYSAKSLFFRHNTNCSHLNNFPFLKKIKKANSVDGNTV